MQKHSRPYSVPKLQMPILQAKEDLLSITKLVNGEPHWFGQQIYAQKQVVIASNLFNTGSLWEL